MRRGGGSGRLHVTFIGFDEFRECHWVMYAMGRTPFPCLHASGRIDGYDRLDGFDGLDGLDPVCCV
jgi:hypothetical protein